MLLCCLMDYDELDRLIDQLEQLGDLAAGRHRRWSEVWEHIKLIGQEFKQTRYPTKADKDQAWNRHQRIIDDIKKRQAWQRQEDETRSTQARDDVLWHAYRARTCLEEHPILDSLPPSPDRRELLLAATGQMRDAWRVFSERKGEMLGQDKKEVWTELRGIQDTLDFHWDEYKKRQAERRQEWVGRQQANRDKLKEWLSNLYDKKYKIEQNIEKLHGMLNAARSDEHQGRVQVWLREAEDRLDGINADIDRVERYLQEADEALRS